MKLKKEKKKWGNKMIGQKSNPQWTTKIGEGVVKHILELRGENPRRPQKREGCCPDWETDKHIYEVKTRSWAGPGGTAGEKVLGVPYKYSEVPKNYEKSLKIVCVAYQEYELEEDGNKKIFGNVSENKREQLNLWKKQGIEFIKFSDLIKDIDYK